MMSLRRLAFLLLAFALVMAVGFAARAPRAEAVATLPVDRVAVLRASEAGSVPPPPAEQDI
jgi:hypothetical protein